MEGTKPTPLISNVERIQDLSPATIDGMWTLFSRFYDDISYDRFRKDLSQKNHVVICRDVERHQVKGFSTIHLYSSMVGKREAKILFSGDTIVSPEYWGYKGLHSAFAKFAFMEWLRAPFTPFYWFLISKGYKTYLTLTRNFVDFWPRHNEPTPPVIQGAIESLAVGRFGDAWVPEQGILRFSTPQGRLRDGVTPITMSDLSDPDIHYFVKANPGHAKGEELCCLAQFNVALWTRFVRKCTTRSLAMMLRFILPQTEPTPARVRRRE